MNTVDAALDYVRRGWAVVPVPRGQKGPAVRQWQQLRLSEVDVPQHFTGNENIGILTGEASGGLVDVDLDCDESVALTAAFLPTTRMRSGRASRPNSHRWYLVDAIPDYGIFNDVDEGKSALLELRGNGHQTLVAPSAHPEGEPYEWYGPLEPEKVDGQDLERAVGRLAAATIVARHWPKRPGSRHSIANALAGMLLRGGWSEEETVHFVRDVVSVAGDEEAQDRARAAVATARKLDQGGSATGGPTLAAALGENVVDKVREWLGLGGLTAYTAYRSTESNPWPEPLGEAAFIGPAGEFVGLVEPRTEADPVALLVQFLVGYGNLVGRGAHFRAEADLHYTNLFGAFVGVSSKGRKGTSKGHVRRILHSIDETWVKDHEQSGLSSGEGLIWAVRDEIWTRQPIRKGGRVVDYQDVQSDPGVSDKRLLVYESELASTLRVLGRDGNTLSPLIRRAWDVGDLQTLTKNSPAKASNAHISIIGHITRDELRRYLDRTETGNGFANRFLWICVKRARVLPEGGCIDEIDFGPLVKKLDAARSMAKSLGHTEVVRDVEARELWCSIYPTLSEGRPGLLGAVTSRAESQVMRLALIYALLDRSQCICRNHLDAALAVWSYAEASARYIFGDAVGDPVADQILAALRAHPEGLTRTEIRELFNRNRRAERIDRALGLLQEHGLARPHREETGGRPAERWFAATGYAVNAINAVRGPGEEGYRVNRVYRVDESGAKRPKPPAEAG